MNHTWGPAGSHVPHETLKFSIFVVRVTRTIFTDFRKIPNCLQQYQRHCRKTRCQSRKEWEVGHLGLHFDVAITPPMLGNHPVGSSIWSLLLQPQDSATPTICQMQVYFIEISDAYRICNAHIHKVFNVVCYFRIPFSKDI